MCVGDCKGVEDERKCRKDSEEEWRSSPWRKKHTFASAATAIAAMTVPKMPPTPADARAVVATAVSDGMTGATSARITGIVTSGLATVAALEEIPIAAEIGGALARVCVTRSHARKAATAAATSVFAAMTTVSVRGVGLFTDHIAVMMATSLAIIAPTTAEAIAEASTDSVELYMMASSTAPTAPETRAARKRATGTETLEPRHEHLLFMPSPSSFPPSSPTASASSMASGMSLKRMPPIEIIVTKSVPMMAPSTAPE